MKRFGSLAVCASLLCTPIPLFSGTFGPPDGENRIIPPLELFGEQAEAFDFQHRTEEDERMGKTGLFDPKAARKNFSANIQLKGKDITRQRGEFFISGSENDETAAKSFELTHQSNSENPLGGTVVSEIEEKGICRYYFLDRGVAPKHVEVVALVKNISFIYISYGTENPRKMVEEFLEKYVAFLEGKITAQEPVIPERTWTSNGGKEMKGSVLSYDSEKNTISFRRFDGKVYPAMSLDLLSAEGQKAIREKLGEPRVE